MIGEIIEGFDPALAQRAARFAQCAGFYGVPAGAFEQVFTWLGQRYRLSACSARRCKFPFTAERLSDGKLIRLPCKVIRAAFLTKAGLPTEVPDRLMSEHDRHRAKETPSGL
jgi:hypothetical protein